MTRVFFVCSSYIFFSFLSLSSCSFYFFFFKQKTAYEMRISDWSSDVCSSDLHRRARRQVRRSREDLRRQERSGADRSRSAHVQIGRASCRERVCQYV